MKVGLVTCADIHQLTVSEQRLIPLFKSKGVFAEAVVWSDPTIEWTDYDYLIIRSVWDYHLAPQDFSLWMATVEELGVRTLNPIALLRSNQHKFYLRTLEEKGVAIVPTLFIGKTEAFDLSIVDRLGWQQAVIKPAISASSFLTETFRTDDWKPTEKRYVPIARERDLLVQKFMPEVLEFGELSIIFLNRKYSHTVLKQATAGEFRVQSEFGGTTQKYRPDAEILKTASDILSQFEGTILYARIDGLLHAGKFVLMEIELIEPDLFLEYDQEASSRFVHAALEIMGPIRT